MERALFIVHIPKKDGGLDWANNKPFIRHVTDSIELLDPPTGQRQEAPERNPRRIYERITPQFQRPFPC
jgi:hypothetical protein